MNTLKELDKELAEIKELYDVDNDPSMKLAEGEEVIGEANDECKRIFTLANRLMNQDLIECDKINPDYDMLASLRYTCEVLHSLMWLSIRRELNTWDNTIGIRQGWKVVKMAEDTLIGSPIETLLRGLSRL